MKLKDYFRSKKNMVFEIECLEETIRQYQAILDASITKSIKNIEELEQDKTYVLFTDEENKENVKDFLKLIKEDLRWTIPKIFISTAPIKEK